jgi:hypothetical protein
LVFECNQGNVGSCTIAGNAMRFLRMIVGHGSLSGIQCCYRFPINLC